MEMGNNSSAPPLHIQGRFSLWSPFLSEKLPALLPWALCSATVCSMDTGCWLWWSPSRCLCCSEECYCPSRSTLDFFSSPAVALLALACGLTQSGRGRTAVGWDGLVWGAQKISPEQVPESSTQRIFSHCWIALILMTFFFGMWEEPCSVG